MASLGDVAQMRKGIADNLGRLPDLRVYAFVPEGVHAPMAAVWGPTSLQYNKAHQKGLAQWNFEIVLYVSKIDARWAQQSLDKFVSTTGDHDIKSAIEFDKTLGGSAQDCRLSAMTTYEPLEWGDAIYLTAVFNLEVLA